MGASEEIRTALFNASSKGSKKKERPVAAQGSGAPPASASVAEEVPPVSNAGPVEDLCYDSRHAPNAENGREIRKVADPYADTRALIARLEADHFSRLGHLTAPLEQLREGQRDMSIRAVEMESAIGSITSNLNALSHRVSGLELNLQRPSRSEHPLHNHGHGPTKGPQGGASKIAPSQLPPSFNARLPFTAQYSAPPLISLDPKAVGSNGALNSAPKLITTATSSAPLPDGANLESLPARTGPFARGLEPLQTMLPPFVRVVDYRRYQLDNTEPVPNGAELRDLYRLKTQFDGLYPTLGTYSGANPISLLGFLSTLKEAFNAYGTSEAVAVRALAYFLAKEAKNMYQAQVNPGALDSRNALEVTWPYVTNALIRRFLADDVLQSAYDAVVRATQGASEDEIKFAQRITDAARECCYVFQPMELVNSYV